MVAEDPDDDRTKSFVALTAGAKVSPCMIIDKLYAGGMGEGYLAEDTMSDREVALKFLSIHLCQNEDCRTMFNQEAQAVTESTILTLSPFMKSAMGSTYIVGSVSEMYWSISKEVTNG